MILTWNLDKQLNLTREMRQRQKKIDNDVMSLNCDIIVFFRFMANLQSSRSRILDAWSIKSFINSNLLSYKTWKQNLQISNTAFILLLRVKVLFLPKNAGFLQKIAKHKEFLVLKGIFSKTTCACLLTY